MLLGDHVVRSRLQVRMDLTTPRAVLERLARPCRALNRCDVLPRLVVTGTVPVMHGVAHPYPGSAGRVDELPHVRDAIIGLGNAFEAIPYLATLEDEVVVRIDHQQPRDRRLVAADGHGFPILVTGLRRR